LSKYGSYEDQPILAKLYDYMPGYLARSDIEFFVQCCHDATGRVIELGCGTGRVLIPAAKAGCCITGVDLSPHMLKICRQKIEQLPLGIRKKINLIQSNAVGFEIDEKFGLAIMPFRFFQHLTNVDEQIACLANINRHLKERGRLVFDVFQVDLKRINNPAFMNEQTDFDDIELPDGRKLRRTHKVIVNLFII